MRTLLSLFLQLVLAYYDVITNSQEHQKPNSDRKSRAIKFHIKKKTATTLRPKKIKISKPTQKNYLIIST